MLDYTPLVNKCATLYVGRVCWSFSAQNTVNNKLPKREAHNNRLGSWTWHTAVPRGLAAAGTYSLPRCYLLAILVSATQLRLIGLIWLPVQGQPSYLLPLTSHRFIKWPTSLDQVSLRPAAYFTFLSLKKISTACLSEKGLLIETQNANRWNAAVSSDATDLQGLSFTPPGCVN